MRKYLKTFIKIAVSGLLICLLYSKVDLSDILGKLRNASPAWLALAFFLMVVNTIVSAFKWRLFLRSDNLDQPIPSLWASYITASFFNLFLPSTIGGDAYRIADIGSRTGCHARVAASILADRITGFFALSIYGFFASLLARPLVTEWQWWFYLPSSAAILALLCVAVLLANTSFFQFCLRLLPVKRLREKASAIADQIGNAMRGYAARRNVISPALALSFIFQFDLILAVWAITKAIGLTLPLGVFFLFIPIKTFLEMIPISVFGLGLRDLGYTIFILAMGFIDSEAAACAALISAAEVLLTIIYSLVGGAVFICRKK